MRENKKTGENRSARERLSAEKIEMNWKTTPANNKAVRLRLSAFMIAMNKNNKPDEHVLTLQAIFVQI